MRLPADAYAQSESFQREKRGPFAREWLVFGAAGQLAAAGDFVSHTLGGWPVFAIRGADGAARGFRNVCRHQGMPVIDRPAGTCGELRCRFHGWTYDLAGALIKASSHYPPTEPMENIRLDPIELTEPDGLMFGRIEPGPAAAPPAIALADRRFAAATTTDVEANWKAVTEALLAAPDRRFVWPNGFVFDRGPARIVRQIVPRTFLRTRLIDLVFMPGAAEPAPEAEIEAAARTDKHDAEALQARLAAGEVGADTADRAAFRARVEAACAAADAGQ